MTARASMAELITELRGMAQAGTADYTVGAVTYWSDEQLQQVMDRWRVDYRFMPLACQPDYVSGAYSHTEYRLPERWMERDIDVLDYTGAAYGTALYTIDYDRQLIEFAADTGGSAVYINASAYDLNRAAADIWRQKAAHYASAYDVSADGHKLTRSQLMAQAAQMAAFYEGLSGPVTASVFRGDE